MTELSKFLTFLTNEERGQVLMKFGEIFDAAPNQDELASTLVSPLKVTVELSRAYSRGGIEQVLERSVELSGVDLSSAQAPVSAAESAPENIIEAIGSAVEEAFVQTPGTPGGTPAASEVALQPTPQADPSAPTPSELPKETPPSEKTSVEQAARASEPPAVIEASDASVEPQVDFSAPVKEASESLPESEMPAAPVSAPVSVPAVQEFEDNEPEEFFDEQENKTVSQAEYRVRPVALIFFILLFVPLGLVGIAVLLCVGVALLVIAAAAVGSGVLVVSLAFSGMTIFADIIMTIGVALVCFSVGLLFLWFGVWFLIWSIGGLVRGILRLGKKWCYKEVSAQ